MRVSVTNDCEGCGGDGDRRTFDQVLIKQCTKTPRSNYLRHQEILRKSQNEGFWLKMRQSSSLYWAWRVPILIVNKSGDCLPNLTMNLMFWWNIGFKLSSLSRENSIARWAWGCGKAVHCNDHSERPSRCVEKLRTKSQSLRQGRHSDEILSGGHSVKIHLRFTEHRTESGVNVRFDVRFS